MQAYGFPRREFYDDIRDEIDVFYLKTDAE